MKTDFMLMAIDLAEKNVKAGAGGPFGAMIVLGANIVGRGTNLVTSTMDPTAHAEIVAIRNACKELATFRLESCELYTTCEPCPMCLGAIYWARLSRVFYASSRADAARAGFDDSFIYDQLGLAIDKRSLKMIQIMHDESLSPFDSWTCKRDKVRY